MLDIKQPKGLDMKEQYNTTDPVRLHKLAIIEQCEERIADMDSRIVKLESSLKALDPNSYGYKDTMSKIAKYNRVKKDAYQTIYLMNRDLNTKTNHPYCGLPTVSYVRG